MTGPTGRRGALKRQAQRFPRLVGLVRSVRGWIDPSHRALRLLPRDRAKWVMQPFADTRPDRYPAIFSFVEQLLHKTAAPDLLSYGCSVGDEVFSLRRYFPAATITGVDINPHSIAIARRRLAASPDAKIDFGVMASPTALPSAAYDAVFCMAVLRHGDLQANQPQSCLATIAFSAAEAVATELARSVRPGGYLCLWFSHFPFSLMAAARDFDVVMELPARAQDNQPLYGPDNQRIDGATLSQAIFRKHARDR